MVHVPRRQKDLYVRVAEARRQLASDLHRAPRVSELAEHLELSPDEVDTGLGAVDALETIRPLIVAPPERERLILLLRFFGNQTQTQIAERIRVSQMHVSRLLARTLATLRDQTC